MIVRTYGRRKQGGITRTFSDSAFTDGFDESVSQETSQEHFDFNLAFSSQGSSHWNFDSEFDFSQEPLTVDDSSPVAKKSKNSVLKATVPATATLMEAQEFGEMMEHVDEVNFALDGLRKGHPARIRRASLLSLLSVCSTTQQRRLLRTQGMAKTIIDAILGLSFDDPPSNLAAAALFYVLTSDGQDDQLLDSPDCIHFLLKLLKPIASDATEVKAPTFGCKLLALRKDADTLRDTTKSLDSSSAAIILKVQEILVSCKDMKKPSSGEDKETERPELSPKWIALLTMEKACLSTISLEDTSGTVKRTGGNFKEKLQELGGLDAVFEVAVDCHSIMEGWLGHSSPSMPETRYDSDLQSLVLLLKCLKIMENATFLSMENQCHLLGMRGKTEGRPQTFTRLIISVIKILSGLSLRRSSSANSSGEKSYNLSNGIDNGSHLECKAYTIEKPPSCSSRKCSSTEKTSSEKSFSILSKKTQWLSSARLGCSTSSSATTNTSVTDTNVLKMRVNSSKSSSSSRSSNGDTSINTNASRMNLGHSKSSPNVTEDDGQDPFAFDEDELAPSKWDLLSGNPKAPQARKRKRKTGKTIIQEDPFAFDDDACQSQAMMSQQEQKINGESHHSCEISGSSSSTDEEFYDLLADCLLTAVKVLMNLTNDNPLGCQQIAACGGLETMSSLIADHFPSFSLSSSPSSEIKGNNLSQSSVELENQNDGHLTDQELDFLVAILGLLVNLVEKDSQNRSRLASASVLLPSSDGLEEENCQDVILLLCSIFLANQGAGEAVEEGKTITWNDEAALLQGEKEAEKMIVEAYAALLLAFLSTESRSTRDAISECLPDHNLRVLVPVLERFVAFHLTLNMISPETHTAVSEVIESCRVP